MSMRGLYAIVDHTSTLARGLDPLMLADALLIARPTALQLRAKDAPDDVVLHLLRALAPKCRRAGVLLVANDRADLALRAECDMVHIGQTDNSAAEVRAIAPSLPFGISTHDEPQLRGAVSDAPHYIAFGPIFTTSTKTHADPAVGLAALESAALACKKIPLVAIGGLTLDRAQEVSRIADMAAVIGDLMPPRHLEQDAAYDWVVDRARAFQALFEAAR